MNSSGEQFNEFIGTRQSFIAAVRSYVGVKYTHQGRSRAGVDCIGLVLCAGHDAGVISDDDFDRLPRDYSGDPDGARLVWLLHRYCRRLRYVRDALPGDIVAIRYHDEPQHIGVVSAVTKWGPKMIHAVRTRDVHETWLDRRWLDSHRARIFGAFRIKPFVDETEAEFVADDADDK